MSAKRQERPEVLGTGAAPLLYWLAVVSGLAGLTIFRLDDLDNVVPVWFGSVVGVAIGQLLGVLRIRVWTIAITVFAMSWFLGPGFYFSLVALFGPGHAAETAFMALLPAFVCGYASLTERGGLLAFWYPAMLWMLVILEGEAPGSFAPAGSLPLMLGLAALFIAFLRARETRRVALWKAYATVGLAAPAPRMVLRRSPARGMAQLLWSVGVGAGALLLTTWIAPKLWEKDRTLHRQAVLAASAPRPLPRRADDGLPCCPDDHVWESARVREYMPLRSSREEVKRVLREQELMATCSYCAPPPSREQLWYASSPGVGVRRMDARTLYGEYTWPDDFLYGGYGYGYYARGGGGGGAIEVDPSPTTYGSSYSITNNGWGNDTPGIASGYPLPSYTPPPVHVDPTPAPAKPYVDPIVNEAVKAAKAKKPTAPKATPAAPVVAPPATTKPVVAAAAPAPVPALAPPKAPEVTPETTPAVVAVPEGRFPWGLAFPLIAGAFLLPIASRTARRSVTVRHLSRPFWRETTPQRISNHWQRMLIALRDAGIQMRKNEQPGAFATRIGIAGMKECAEILERVRHGVRIEDEDLGLMDKSADAVVATSRERAGLVGRVAGAFRWPLV